MKFFGCNILIKLITFIVVMPIVFAFGGASVYWMFNNELNIHLSEIAKYAIDISSSNPNQNSHLNNKLVSTKVRLKLNNLLETIFI